MDILEVFGRNVRKYRELKGLSQEAFAEKCGLHRTYISAVERQRRSIALGNVQKIAEALDVDIYKLFLPESENSSVDVLEKGNWGDNAR